jgi:SAM-dependent methyltransferase
MNERPLALEAYETLSERFAARVDNDPYNALYDRPATLALLPNVKGKRVLDAGCGPGVYAELLVDRGARVTAIDVSPKMVQLARERLGKRAEVLLADIEKPLEFASPESFDLIVSPLVLDYVRDLDAVFGEFWRILCPGGHLVFSVSHPFGNYLRHPEGGYFESRVIPETWCSYGEPVVVPFCYRSMSGFLNPLIEAGFNLERIIEPVPVEAFKEVEPEDYERLMRQPGFLSMRACKA